MGIITNIEMGVMSKRWEVKSREDRIENLEHLIEKSVADITRCKDDFSPESASIHKTLRERLIEINDLEREIQAFDRGLKNKYRKDKSTIGVYDDILNGLYEKGTTNYEIWQKGEQL